MPVQAALYALYEYIDNAWKEKGVEETKNMTSAETSTNDGYQSQYRLVLKGEQLHEVYFNQAITKDFPVFFQKGDREENVEGLGKYTTLIKDNLAIKFEMEADLNDFIDSIKSLQDAM